MGRCSDLRDGAAFIWTQLSRQVSLKTQVLPRDLGKGDHRKLASAWNHHRMAANTVYWKPESPEHGKQSGEMTELQKAATNNESERLMFVWFSTQQLWRKFYLHYGKVRQAMVCWHELSKANKYWQSNWRKIFKWKYMKWFHVWNLHLAWNSAAILGKFCLPQFPYL